MKKTFIYALLSLFLALSLMLTACQAGETGEAPKQEMESEPEAEPTAAPTEPPADESEEVGAAVDVQLDPATIEQEELLEICGYIYEGLVALDGDTVVPALATTWTVSDDTLSYTFQLRPDVTFHDGTPLNADIVIANFNRWFDTNHPLHGIDKEYPAWLEAFGGFEGEVDSDGVPKASFDGIEKVNNLTVLIHLNRQDPNLLQKLANVQFSILNTILLADEGDLYGTSQGSIVGTGPYMLEEWSGGTLLLSPYADYWGTPPESELELTLP